MVCAGGGGIPVIVTPAGSIRGVEAAYRFVEATVGMVGIGELEDSTKILSGERGTIIRAK